MSDAPPCFVRCPPSLGHKKLWRVRLLTLKEKSCGYKQRYRRSPTLPSLLVTGPPLNIRRPPSCRFRRCPHTIPWVSTPLRLNNSTQVKTQHGTSCYPRL